MKKDLSLLFVCLGNICRSPAAECMMRRITKAANLDYKIYCDSAGTHASTGSAPDARMCSAAADRGLGISGRSRPVVKADFKHFDYIFTMDEDNYHRCMRLADTAEQRAKIHRLLAGKGVSLKDASPKEVPDPYYGLDQGFEKVLDLVESACYSWLEHFKKN